MLNKVVVCEKERKKERKKERERKRAFVKVALFVKRRKLQEPAGQCKSVSVIKDT